MEADFDGGVSCRPPSAAGGGRTWGLASSCASLTVKLQSQTGGRGSTLGWCEVTALAE